MKISESLAINLKYYRKKYNLSQEKFAEILGTSLVYLNRIENRKVNVKVSTIDKFVTKINDYDKMAGLEPNDLVVYKQEHVTCFKRIDERIK